MNTHKILHKDLGPTQLPPQQNCFFALNCLSLRNLPPKKFHSIINKQLINIIADSIIYLLKCKPADVKFAPFLMLKFQ